MTGVTTIIAAVALFIGMIAIWLVTEGMKKLEKQTRKLIDVHIKSLRQPVQDLSRSVSDIKAGQEDLRNRVRDVVRNREAADGELASLRKELNAITSVLDQAGGKSGKNGSATPRSGRA